MMVLAAAHGPSALWYATRGAGAVTLLCLTASVVLGIVEVRALQPAGAPRFAVAWLHRSVSLLALALLVVHITTTLLDPFPRFSISAVLVPFTGSYRPLWVGLGALASDLLIALVLTSLVRRHLGFRAWRGVHWAAYACWPVALLHGLGTGSDSRTTWMLALVIGCVAAVAAAVTVRLAAPGTSPQLRSGGIAGLLLAVLGAGIWAQQGPLARGWARRAGTPQSVLAAFRPPAPARVRHETRPAARTPPAPAPPRAFTASLSGTVRSGLSTDESAAVVDLRMRLASGPPRRLRIRISGQPLETGGVRMERSAVTFGPPSRPGEYQGRIEMLQDGTLRALVGSRDGRAMRLQAALQIGDGVVHGRVSGTPVT